MVTVKGYVDRVVIVAGGQVVATHTRSLKPAHAGPRPAPLPRDSRPQARRTGPCSGVPGLEASGLLHRRSAPSWKNTTARLAGTRRFVRVLQLLADHPLARVRQAVEACRREQLISAEAVIQRTRTLAAM